jgi:phage tail-like protein
MSNPGLRNDPLPCFCFLVHIKGVEAFFKSVSGLRSETEAVSLREGGANDTTFNLVGATKWSPLVLKNGFTADSRLLTWREDWVTQRSMERQSGVITQLDTALRPMGRWTFHRGWPTKWELTEFDAAKSELSIETLEIVHEGLSYQSLSRPTPPSRKATARPSAPRPSAAPRLAASASAAPRLQHESPHRFRDLTPTRDRPPTPAPTSAMRAPTNDEVVSLGKARFPDIDFGEEPTGTPGLASETARHARDPVPTNGSRAPTDEEITSLGKARFPDVE